MSNSKIPAENMLAELADIEEEVKSYSRQIAINAPLTIEEQVLKSNPVKNVTNQTTRR